MSSRKKKFTPEHLLNLSLACQKRSKNKKYLEKMRAAVKKAYTRPEAKKNASDAAKKRNERAAYRKLQSLSQKESWEDPKIRAKRIAGMRQRLDGPKGASIRRKLSLRTSQKEKEYRDDPAKMRSRSRRQSISRKRLLKSMSAKEMQSYIASRPGFGRPTTARPTKPEAIIRIAARGTYLRYNGNNKKCVAGFFPDFLSKTLKKIVEVDGKYFHDTAEGRKRDRTKDRVYRAAGYDVLRLTDTEVFSTSLEDLQHRIQSFVFSLEA